jgi:hypothetical protein
MKVKISLLNEDFKRSYEFKEIDLIRNILKVYDYDMSGFYFANRGQAETLIGFSSESKLLLTYYNSERIDDNERLLAFRIL